MEGEGCGVGWKTPCIMKGYCEPTGVEGRGGSFTITERSRVFLGVALLYSDWLTKFKCFSCSNLVGFQNYVCFGQKPNAFKIGNENRQGVSIGFWALQCRNIKSGPNHSFLACKTFLQEKNSEFFSWAPPGSTENLLQHLRLIFKPVFKKMPAVIYYSFAYCSELILQ